MRDTHTPPPLFFPPGGFLRHLQRGVFATCLYMVTQIPTEMAKFLPRWAHDGRTKICADMTDKRGDTHLRTFAVTNTHTTTNIHATKGAQGGGGG